MDSEHIAKYLYELRKKHGLTQKKIAHLCSVSTQAVSKWEKGASIPDIESLKKLSEYYGVSINTLLDGGKKKRTDRGQRQRALALFFALLFSCLAFFLPFSPRRIPSIWPDREHIGLQILIEGRGALVVQLVRIQAAGLLYLLLMHGLLAFGILRSRPRMKQSFNAVAALLLLIGLYATALRWLLFLPQIVLASGLILVLVFHDFFLFKAWRFFWQKLKSADASPTINADGDEKHPPDPSFGHYVIFAVIFFISAFLATEALTRLVQSLSLIGTAIPLMFYVRNFIVYPFLFLAVAVLNLWAIKRFRHRMTPDTLILLGVLNLLTTALFHPILVADSYYMLIGVTHWINAVFVAASAAVLVTGLLKRYEKRTGQKT